MVRRHARLYAARRFRKGYGLGNEYHQTLANVLSFLQYKYTFTLETKVFDEVYCGTEQSV